MIKSKLGDLTKASVTLVVTILLTMNCVLAFQYHKLKSVLSNTQTTNTKLQTQVDDLNNTLTLLEEENEELATTVDEYAIKYRNIKIKYADNGFKSYEDYSNITNKSSKQYKLIHSSKIHVNSDGLLRDNYGYIGVAVGSYYGSVGDHLILTTDSGNIIKVIIVDQKASGDTKGNSVQKQDGSMVEFVISTAKAKLKYAKALSTGNLSNISGFGGKVVKVTQVKFI